MAGNRFQPRLYDLPSNDPSWPGTQDSRNSTFRVFDSQTWVPDSDPSISDSNVIVSAYLYCLALLRLFPVGGFESTLLLSPFLASNCYVAQNTSSRNNKV